METKMFLFCNIFYKTWAILIKFGLYTVFRINLLQIIWKFSISPEQCLYTTLWKLKCSSDMCCHWVVTERNFRIYPTSTLAPNSPDLNSVDFSVRVYCKRRCTKYASLIWTNQNSEWERSGPSWIMSSLRQPFISGVVDSSRSVMRVKMGHLLEFLFLSVTTHGSTCAMSIHKIV